MNQYTRFQLANLGGYNEKVNWECVIKHGSIYVKWIIPDYFQQHLIVIRIPTIGSKLALLEMQIERGFMNAPEPGQPGFRD